MDGFKNEITLEAVLEDKLSSPVSKTDFRLYLTYEEHSVENLDFFEWYQDYKKRFDDLPCATKSLSPPPQKQYRALGNPSSTTIDMELLQHSKTPPSLIPYIPTFAEPDSNVIELEHLRDSTKFLQRPLPASIPAPTTTTSLQPFRLEIDHILATHIIQGSPNELNLTAAARDYILKHARLTTDPRALLPAVEEALETMRQGSFVNFWKLTAGRNIGTLGRSLWVLAMIWFWIFLPLGFAVVLVPMLLGKSRWWRLLAFPLLWVGVVCTRLSVGWTLLYNSRQYEVDGFLIIDKRSLLLHKTLHLLHRPMRPHPPTARDPGLPSSRSAAVVNRPRYREVRPKSAVACVEALASLDADNGNSWELGPVRNTRVY
ncbi:hypothetical protein BC938DRAFT_470574 [Jimgerdemannia flammicorona]|uniref:RGS domain-containing protein n=1 Tax=Jimgerdemannia flammicorona TaxID=994334 RepID=A0A433QV42_9FUNG|nr:hypothetical protein BC938DRAFT_470574 [Jimgerdemannia flammicorona]